MINSYRNAATVVAISIIFLSYRNRKQKQQHSVFPSTLADVFLIYLTPVSKGRLLVLCRINEGFVCEIHDTLGVSKAFLHEYRRFCISRQILWNYYKISNIYRRGQRAGLSGSNDL